MDGVLQSFHEVLQSLHALAQPLIRPRVIVLQALDARVGVGIRGAECMQRGAYPGGEC